MNPHVPGIGTAAVAGQNDRAVGSVPGIGTADRKTPVNQIRPKHACLRRESEENKWGKGNLI